MKHAINLIIVRCLCRHARVTIGNIEMWTCLVMRLKTYLDQGSQPGMIGKVGGDLVSIENPFFLVDTVQDQVPVWCSAPNELLPLHFFFKRTGKCVYLDRMGSTTLGKRRASELLRVPEQDHKMMARTRTSLCQVDAVDSPMRLTSSR